MSIIKTLVTDRTLADVDRRLYLNRLWDPNTKTFTGTDEEFSEFLTGTKGTYNAEDLNRVTAAMDYLKTRLGDCGYAVKNYKNIEVNHPWYKLFTATNSVLNGNFSNSGEHWTFSKYNDTVFENNGVTISLNTDGEEGAGTYPNYQLLELTAGHKYWFRFEYKAPTSNYSGPRVYLRYYPSGSTTAAFINFSGVSNTGDDWVSLGTVYKLSAERTWDRLAFGINSAVKAGDTMSIRGVQMVDLTAAFGAGQEPDSEWCEANIPYFEGTKTFEFGGKAPDPHLWYERDVPTPSSMNAYLSNLTVLREQFAQASGTPSVPENMERLTYTEANNIEKILEDIDLLLTYAAKAWFFSDDVFSGEV